jgi:hypothetical protein
LASLPRAGIHADLDVNQPTRTQIDVLRELELQARVADVAGGGAEEARGSRLVDLHRPRLGHAQAAAAFEVHCAGFMILGAYEQHIRLPTLPKMSRLSALSERWIDLL